MDSLHATVQGRGQNSVTIVIVEFNWTDAMQILVVPLNFQLSVPAFFQINFLN